MASAVSLTEMAPTVVRVAPVAMTSNGPPLNAELKGRACAVHLSEPSGQNASGQDCSAWTWPSVARRAKFLPRCLPLGQGVPKVMPLALVPLGPSSQRTQLPAAGLAAMGDADVAGVVALALSNPAAAEVIALLERNCRREIRFAM